MQQYSLHSVSSAPQPESAVLCRFPHGPPAELSDPDAFSSLTFTLHAPNDSRDARKASQRLLTVDSARVEWVGRNFAADSFKLSPYTYAVGVVHDAERRIDLLPVNHIYSMQQHIKHRLPKAAPEPAPRAEADSYAARQKALVDAFGSRKRRSQLASRESNRVVVQQEIADVLDVALEANAPDPDAPQEEDDQALLRRTKRAILPPFDEFTNDPAAIFLLHDLIPKPIYALLQTDAKRLHRLAKDERLLTQLIASAASATPGTVKAEEGEGAGKKSATLAEHQLSRFGLFLLQRVKDSTDHTSAMRACALLSFFHLLLALKLSNPRFPRRALTALPHPPAAAVLTHLLDTFAVSSPGPATSSKADPHPSYAIDSTGTRRVLCYLLVTSLLLGGGTLSGRGAGPDRRGYQAGRWRARRHVQGGGLREGVQGRGTADSPAHHGPSPEEEEAGRTLSARQHFGDTSMMIVPNV